MSLNSQAVEERGEYEADTFSIYSLAKPVSIVPIYIQSAYTPALNDARYPLAVFLCVLS